MRFSRPIKAAGLLAATLLVLAGCATPETPGSSGGSPQAGGDLIMVRADDPTTMMPTDPTDNASIWVIQNVFDTLVVASPDGKELEPGLAESWEQSADRLSWTFQLRPGVTFHNGAPMTPEDVKFSIDQATNPELPFGDVNSQIAKVEAPDDATVVVTTKVPWSPLPADLALFTNSIVPKDLAGMSKEEFGDRPIGTGPFKVDSWTKGQSLKIVKNPDYWQQGRPYLDSVTFNTVPDSNTRAEQLLGDQAQVNEFPPYSTVEGLKSTPGLKLESFESSMINYININHRAAPLDDVHLRRALSYALDRNAMINAVTYGQAQVATTFMSPALWGHDPTIKGLEFNLDQAKAELAQSKYAGGTELELTVAAGDPDSSAIAQIAQEAFSKIGVTLKINPMDPAAARQNRMSGNFQLMTGYATTDIVDPDQMVGFLVKKGNGINSGYDNAEINGWADQAAQTEQQEDRKKLYSQIQQTATEDVALIPLYYSPAIFSTTEKVQGFRTTAVGTYTLRDTWLAR